VCVCVCARINVNILNVIDPRERYLVCKLDRYQLEDKYLRLLEEANSLKKLSNCQEDKLKRLGTKLIRLASTPRSCGLALDIADDRNRTTALELENTKVGYREVAINFFFLYHTCNFFEQKIVFFYFIYLHSSHLYNDYHHYIKHFLTSLIISKKIDWID